MSWYWNEINDKESASYATTTAVWISYLIAVVDGTIGILSFIYSRSIMGIEGRGWLLGAFLFSLVGRGIARMSRAWALVGVSVYLLGVTISFGTLGLNMLVAAIMAFIFLAVYINALRGTFAYHKYQRLSTENPTPPPSP